jgi:chromosome segregation ATPase
MEVFMFRKVSAAVLTSLVVLSGVTAPAATAATKISNGVACSKANSTKTVGGYKYRCAKNAKLTWLSFECLTATKQWQTATKAQRDLVNVADQTAALDAEYLAAQASLASTTAALEKARAQVTQFQAQMNATTNSADKSKLAASVSKLANAVLVLSGSRSKLVNQVNDLESKKALLQSAPEQLKANATDARASASLLCAKGF